VRALRFAGSYFEEIVASAFLVIMSVATFANVIARYVFATPIPWAEELARYSFIWLVFIGAAVCTKRGRHVAVDAAVKLLPAFGRQFCDLLVKVGITLLTAILVYYGVVLMLSATQPTSTLNIPTYLVYLAVPLSGLSILLRTLADIVRDVQKLGRAS
jgi:TRAP-type C4-dicarboxylate transport system permease small subunit